MTNKASPVVMSLEASKKRFFSLNKSAFLVDLRVAIFGTQTEKRENIDSDGDGPWTGKKWTKLPSGIKQPQTMIKNDDEKAVDRNGSMT
jgi:hypothetical protein